MQTAEVLRERLAASLDPAWLIAQRWFRAKQRSVVGIEPYDLVPLDASEERWLAVVTVSYADGGEQRYLLPMTREERELREPRDGDGVWRLLALLIVSGGELAGRHGAFVFSPARSAADLLPGGTDELAAMPERRLGVEQSNTSAALGDRLIVKLYRLLEAGENPDVEVGAFLTAAGFHHTPPLAGFASYLADDAVSSAAAMLSAFVPSHGDGWGWALERLSRGPADAELAAGLSTIGEISAEMHAALASRPGDPAFPARPATSGERAAWHAEARAQLGAALAAAGPDGRPRLEVIAPAIGNRLAALEGSGDAAVSRIHGDYHLGQLLRTDDGFAVIDFEGEPARPLVERRRPSCPLRDVAGMLRSLDYAARTRAAAGDAFDADAWLRDARAAFLAGYGGIGPAEQPLLTAFEIEKACYEVRYEANHRPEWLWLPIAALERLAA